MNSNGNASRLRLKESTGWFAAGASFETALVELSDGAFRLFAWICLKADRHTGRFQSTHRELSIELSRSRRAIGSYIQELEGKGICRVRSAINQHGRTSFEISESYWPYERIETEKLDFDVESYIGKIRDLYLKFGCGNGNFSAADRRTAVELFNRGIPDSVVEDAILLGCARKYVSSLTEAERGSATNGSGWSPIGSLAYFEPLIEEVKLTPLSSDYKRYLLGKAKAYSQRSSKQANEPPARDSAGAKS